MSLPWLWQLLLQLLTQLGLQLGLLLMGIQLLQLCHLMTKLPSGLHVMLLQLLLLLLLLTSHHCVLLCAWTTLPRPSLLLGQLGLLECLLRLINSINCRCLLLLQCQWWLCHQLLSLLLL